MFAYGEKKRLFQTNRIYLIPAFYPSFTPVILHPEYLLPTTCHSIEALVILGDPGADSGDEGKSKRPKRCGTKKRKERREEPLGTMSYQTSSKRSPPFCLLIGARKLVFFWHQSEAGTAATVWNWSGKTLSPRALLAVLYFSSCLIFPPV